jgi:hypothetical protein
LHSQEIAELLPCRPDQISWLVRQGLLRPLGNPRPNATRWFAVTTIMAALSDVAWLDAATEVLSDRDRVRNRARKRRQGRGMKFGSPVIEHGMPTPSFGE